jgi:hypothetical protein
VEWAGAAGLGPQVVLIEAEDGARQNYSWRGGPGLADCTFLRLGDDRLRCVPGWTNRTFGRFADATCKQPAAVVDKACASSTRVMVEPVPGQCPGRAQVLALGPRLAATYDGSPDQCVPARIDLSELVDFHAVGARLPDQVFPALEIVDEPTTHPLQRQIALAGVRAVTWGWRDKQRGPCFPLLYQGKRLCIPSAAAEFSHYYADAACKEPLWRTSRDSCPVEFVTGADHHSGCPQKRILFAVGGVHTGNVFQLSVRHTDDRREHVCGPVPSSTTEAYHRLTPIPDDQLLELKLVEPF